MKYNIYETYCELWARIINVIFNSFLILKEKDNFSKSIFREVFNKLIKAEQEIFYNSRKKGFNKFNKEQISKREK